MLGKVFYGVEDIYLPDSRAEVFEELKPMITGGDGLGRLKARASTKFADVRQFHVEQQP